MSIERPLTAPEWVAWVRRQIRALDVRIANLGVRTGAGSPEGVVTARVGTLYTRSDGGVSTTLYVKTSGSGNTGWTAK